MKKRKNEIIIRYGKVLGGHRLKVVVEDSLTNSNEIAHPFYKTATSEEWSYALRTWAAGHAVAAPLLSDEALDRANIYEERSG